MGSKPRNLPKRCSPASRTRIDMQKPTGVMLLETRCGSRCLLRSAVRRRNLGDSRLQGTDVLATLDFVCGSNLPYPNAVAVRQLGHWHFDHVPIVYSPQMDNFITHRQ